MHEFETLAVAWGLVLVLFARFHRDLLLVSIDPDTARVLGRSAARGEALLFLMTGLTVSAGALVVGPIVLFGLLVIPPMAAHGLARSMRGFHALSVVFGVIAAAGGLYVSFRLDWPLGPAVCAVAGATLVPAFVGRRLLLR